MHYVQMVADEKVVRLFSGNVEQNIVIYIGIWNALSIVASIVLGAWYAAYRLARVETQLATLETYVAQLTGRVDNLYDDRSPVVRERAK